ncbi:MAG: DUF6328 family protein [Acidimicrobiales bacterium]
MAENESPQERLDREHEQLFQELRAIIPGAEVLFAFMLTVAFSERFEGLTSTQRNVYYGTLMCAGAALILLLAPSAFHRLRFRQGDKEAMMRAANTEVIIALGFIALSVSGVLFLITDVLFSTRAAIVAGVSTWSITAVLWWAYPLVRRVREPAPDQTPQPAGLLVPGVSSSDQQRRASSS